MVWPIMGISLFEVMPLWPILLVYMVWPIMGISLFRDIMLVDISGSITLEVISWPIMPIDMPWFIIFEVISRPIMLIMLEPIPRFIISEDLYMVDIWLFLGMLNEYISRPIILLDILRKSFPSSLSELESM